MSNVSMHPELIYGGLFMQDFMGLLPKEIVKTLESNIAIEKVYDIIKLYEFHDLAHDLTHILNTLTMMVEVQHEVPNLYAELEVNEFELILAILYHDIGMGDGMVCHEIRSENLFRSHESNYIDLIGAAGIDRVAVAIRNHHSNGVITSNLSRILNDLVAIESFAQGLDHLNYTFIRIAWRSFASVFENAFSRGVDLEKSNDELIKMIEDVKSNIIEVYSSELKIPALKSVYDFKESLPEGYDTLEEILSSSEFESIYDEFVESYGPAVLENYMKRDMSLYIFNPKRDAEEYRRDLLDFEAQIGSENYQMIKSIVESDMFHYDRVKAIQNLLQTVTSEMEGL